MFDQIMDTISSFDFNSISDDRKVDLEKISAHIRSRKENHLPIFLNFICTHNSRRSHLSQVWAQVGAHVYNTPSVFCFSGGTEATAIYPMIVSTLETQGFETVPLSKGENPVVAISFASELHPVIGFSKVYHHPFNPKNEYAAIMTCNSADKECPIVKGADMRFSLPFQDPKASDGTDHQKRTYLERSVQIGTEMMYLFSRV